MILDKELMLSEKQAVTTTAISSNVMYLGVPSDLGAGEELFLVIKVDEAATAAGAATVDFTLESSSTADLATSPKVHLTTGSVGKAALVKDAVVFKGRIPMGDYKKYLGVRYTVGTGPLTAGKFSAFLVKNVDAYKAYPDAITIS